MGTWQVTSDLLARARFTISAKAEVASAMSALVQPKDPAERAFHAAHHAAFDAMLAEFPDRRDILAYSRRPRHGDRPSWIADYLASPPPVPDATFEQELAAVASTADERLRYDLRETAQRPLPARLDSAGVIECAVGLLS